MHKIASEVFKSMPKGTEFNKKDAEILAKHSEILLALEDKLVLGFYDLLFANAATSQIVTREGSRADREKTLRAWWNRTLTAEIDEDYWIWQAFVGLIHIKQKVNNAMIISMWGWILNTLRSELKGKLSQDDLDELMCSFTRFAATIQSLITESFLENYMQAIREATGFKQELIDRIIGTQIDTMIKIQRAKAK